MFARLEHESQGAQIRCQVDSMVPEKRGGLVCAHVCHIAAIRAVFDYFEGGLRIMKLWYLANRAEMIAHMN